MRAPASCRFLACFLVLALLLSGVPVPATASDPIPPQTVASTEPSVPETVPPAETAPQESLPEETLPEETLPEVTFPEETLPEETLPEVTLPEETLPEETLPEVTLPEETLPEETLPEETLPEETLPEETLPEETQPSRLLLTMKRPEVSGPGLYFGSLHAHSGISENTVSVEELFSSAARTPGLDFFAVTDHSHSFDNHKDSAIGTEGSTVSAGWAAGKAAAAAVTGPSFVGIYGYEMSWPARMQIGHISTFCTPGFQSWQQEAYSTYKGALQNYYSALSSVPDSVSQFNHPGTQYGTFQDFAYSEAADRAVTLLETGSGRNAYSWYIQALDLGWHLAPTASRDSAGSARTVVYAQSLTEEGLYDAMRSCRVYSTEDSDLEILYTMNGHFMGSRLKRRHLTDTISISVDLRDPSDAAVGLVEVITGSGKIAAAQTLSAASGALEFSLPMASGFYFLKITQPDGDTAVTAPIWVDAEEHLGISGLTCETVVPIQNEAVLLNLSLYNGETVDLDITGLEVLADGIPVSVSSDLSRIPAGSNLSHSLSITADCMGLTELTLRLTGTLEGSPRTYEASLKIPFHRSEQVTSILIDGSHGNAGLNRLAKLNQMAMEDQIRMTVAASGISPEALEDCRFLLVSAPSRPFSDAFLETAAEFAGYGGSIILCGQADSREDGFHSAGELNRLLAAIGSSLRMKEDTVEDPVTNQADPAVLFPDTLNTASDWCAGISENQVYQFSRGCSIDPGAGTWLARGFPTTGTSDSGGSEDSPILLACEPLSGGGTVFASGCLFLTDDALAEPKNIFAEPLANRTIARNLLGIGGKVLPLSTIAQARTAAPGTLVRVRGYAVTGTSNPYNTFPDLLYLQDSSGGIVITPFETENIQQGTPLEILGFAGNQGPNRALKLSTCSVLDADLYQQPPQEGSWDTLLDPAGNSQRLVQVEGACLEVYCREDDTLAGCLLKDDTGRTVRIRIEDHIRNGSDGENELHKKIRKGRTVRAMGLLHVDEYGETVIRVRNCEEVVWVPPRNYWNPKTGDALLPAAILCSTASFLGLLLLRKRKNA